MCMSVRAHTHMHTRLCMSSHQHGQRLEALNLPEAAVAGTCEAPDVGSGN